MLETQSNDILTAIVHGMKKDESSDYVRLAATNALLNSLEFTKANFDVEVIIFLQMAASVTGRFDIVAPHSLSTIDIIEPDVVYVVFEWRV